jgi:hypothetical protein
MVLFYWVSPDIASGRGSGPAPAQSR